MHRSVIQFEITTGANRSIRYYSGRSTYRIDEEFKNAYIYTDNDELQRDLIAINDSHIIKSLVKSNFSDVKITILIESIGKDKHRIWIDSKIKLDVDALSFL